MQIENLLFTNNNWNNQDDSIKLENVDFVTLFGDTDEFAKPQHYEYFKKRYPNANIIGCSSSGNILGDEINDSSMVATAISFEKASTTLHTLLLDEEDNHVSLLKNMASKIEVKGLRHLFILADGLNINGSNILKAFNSVHPNITKTGGMAGDGERVLRTYVVSNDVAKQNVVSVLAFYGESLHFGHGTQGGWSPFGTKRVITKSSENTLYEVEGESILDYYERYVGQYSDNIQDAGFRYPLSVKENEESIGVIRTLVSTNKEESSITFAGDIPQGHTIQLMKPNIDSLIDGASDAAKEAKQSSDNPSLALIVSCTGRRIVMDKLIDEELEAIAEELGNKTQLTGFYSYGELAPLHSDVSTCILHNETMTLTVIYED